MIGLSRRDAAVLYALIGVMVMCWSGNYIAAKIAVAAVPPLMVACLRLTFAGVAILPLYWRQQSLPRSRDRWTWSEAPFLFTLGLIGVTLNQICFVLGISYTSVAHAGIIIALTPLCVLLIAVALRMEPLTRTGALGMLIALAGVAVLQVSRGTSGSARPTLKGDAIVFGATLTFSWFTIFNKRISHIHTGTTVNTFAYAGGAIVLIPLTLFELAHHDVSHLAFPTWLAIVYMALFPSVLAYLIYSWALKRVPASQLAAFSYLQPLLATILAAFVLDEPVTPALAASGAVILAGVMITERAREAVA